MGKKRELILGKHDIIMVLLKNVKTRSQSKIIYDTLNQFGDEWILNLICLEEEQSYMIASNDLILQNIQKLLNGKIQGNYIECGEVWLRKEIIKKAEKVK